MSAVRKPDPEACVLALVSIATIPIAYAVEAAVLWKAWDWWFLDLGAPSLPYGTAVAIVFVVGFLTVNIGVERDPKRTLSDQWTIIAIAPLTLWVLGLVAS